MRVLVTGAAGFVGAEVVRRILTTTDWDVVALDSFRHRGVTDRLTRAVDGVCPAEYLDGGPGSPYGRFRMLRHDLAAPISAQLAWQIGYNVDCVLALAAGSHVDASISDPRSFVENNVAVQLSTLEYARQYEARHVVLVSTDEVYGSAQPGQVGEPWGPIIPSSPYSASKAAQEAVSIAWWRSYGVPLTIVNMENVYGPMQGAEKFVPKVLAAVLAGRVMPIHGNEVEGAGTRCWVHVSDVASALMHIMGGLPPARFRDGATRPNRWHIATVGQVPNLETAQRVATLVGDVLEWEWSDARPGRDVHYVLDGAGLAAAGWSPAVPFDDGLERTVKWYLQNSEWLLP